MSDINPSLVSSELTTIETFKDTTEKRGSKLTLNELNYISDKQLHKKTDGGGGGGDSPVKAADVRFVTDDTNYSGRLSEVFPNTVPSMYFLAHENYPAFVSPDDFHIYTIANWNANMDDGMRLVTPHISLIHDDNFDISVVSGSAEIMPVPIEGGERSALCITGDCTIQISVKENTNQ